MFTTTPRERLALVVIAIACAVGLWLAGYMR